MLLHSRVHLRVRHSRGHRRRRAHHHVGWRLHPGVVHGLLLVVRIIVIPLLRWIEARHLTILVVARIMSINLGISLISLTLHLISHLLLLYRWVSWLELVQASIRIYGIQIVWQCWRRNIVVNLISHVLVCCHTCKRLMSFLRHQVVEGIGI